MNSERSFPIVTHRPKVPLHWLAFMTLPGLASGYIEFCSGGPLTFVIKKYVNDPAMIAFLISINTLFNFLVGVVCAYTSDRIWTRWGRRRVFLVPGWICLAFCMSLIPMMSSIGCLTLVIVVYQFCQDFASSNLRSLNYEVVPPPQRGRFEMFSVIAASCAGLFYNLVLLAQYDKRYALHIPLGSFGAWRAAITGEHVVFWYGSVFVLAVVAFLAWGVRETPPVDPPLRGRFSPLGFVRDVYGARDLRILYALSIGVCITIAGMATNNVLLVTEQFRYSKANLGQIASVSMVFNVLLMAPVMGFIVDRAPRLRLTQLGIGGIWLTNIVYYVYLKKFAPAGVPPFGMLIMLGLVMQAFGTCYVMSHSPNMYDYVPSNRLGTFASGSSLIIGILLFLLPNAYGLWVKGYSKLFCAPGTYDYTSAFLLNMLLGAIGMSLTFYFRHCVRTGRLVPLGRKEWKKEVKMADATSPKAPSDSNENQAGNDQLGTSNTHQEVKR